MDNSFFKINGKSTEKLLKRTPVALEKSVTKKIFFLPPCNMQENYQESILNQGIISVLQFIFFSSLYPYPLAQD